jgi:hypothetical protein
MSVIRAGAMLRAASENVYEAVWFRYDIAAQLQAASPSADWLKAVAQEAGIPLTSLLSWAEKGALVPPETRDIALSPQWQIQEARRASRTADLGSPLPR